MHHHWLPTAGLPPPSPIRIMSCIGPMARTVEDLALLYAIIAGPDGRDKEVWSHTAGGSIISSPTLADSIIYIGSNDGTIYAFHQVH